MYLENRCSVQCSECMIQNFFPKGLKQRCKKLVCLHVLLLVVCSIAENWHCFPRLFQLWPRILILICYQLENCFIASILWMQVVEIVLRQGLTHPITCVPQLIAMEVDQLEFNSKLAHRLLMQMNEKYMIWDTLFVYFLLSSVLCLDLEVESKSFMEKKSSHVASLGSFLLHKISGG